VVLYTHSLLLTHVTRHLLSTYHVCNVCMGQRGALGWLANEGWDGWVYLQKSAYSKEYRVGIDSVALSGNSSERHIEVGPAHAGAGPTHALPNPIAPPSASVVPAMNSPRLHNRPLKRGPRALRGWSTCPGWLSV
jgi:hypothetical protein